MLQYLNSLIARDERGQGLAEYALILALIAVLAIAAVTFLGGQINAILSDVGNKHLTSRFQERYKAPAERPAPFHVRAPGSLTRRPIAVVDGGPVMPAASLGSREPLIRSSR